MLAAVMLSVIAILPTQADGTMIVGEVTVISTGNANLRSGGSLDYPVVGTGRPGELFQTTGKTSSGWYEILLPNEQFAYISGNLVYFYSYPTPVPLPNQYTVPVYYRTPQGTNLRTEQVPVRVGQNTVTADDSLVPGYSLRGTRTVYVNVNADGSSVPSAVIFTYEPNSWQPDPTPGQGAAILVYYRDIYNQVVASEFRTLQPGTQLLRADSGRLPPGYAISGATDAIVTVSANGAAYPGTVNFIVVQSSQVTTPPPSYVTVPVSYRDAAGNVLFSTSRYLGPGYTTISANDGYVPSGYTLTSPRTAYVYVSNDGVSYPNSVIFTYQNQTQASVQVVYRNTNGTTLYSETRTLSQGTHTITADDSRVGSGLTLQGARSVQLTVYNNGAVSQNQVVFTYAQPVSASVSIQYRDSDGNTLYSESRTLSAGTHTIVADDARVPRGYILQNARSAQVTVYSNGYVSPDRVVFLYRKPVSATLNIVYRDDMNNNLFTETRSLSQGTHTITASDSRVPSGYELQSARNVNVTVNSNGSISPSQVVFRYAPPGPPVTVNVPVYYKDQSGAMLYQSSVEVSSDNPRVLRANDDRVPSGYELISDRAVTVTVSRNGTATPSSYVFTYRAPAGPPVTVTVPVYYKDQTGAILYQSSVDVSSDNPRVLNANDDRVPNGYTLTSDRTVTVSVNRNGVATPSQFVFTYRNPNAPAGITTLPEYQTFSYSGKAQGVYSGPSTRYYRANDGKATLGGGVVRVWGTEGQWALIGYGLSNNLYRVGYIPKAALPKNLNVPELVLSSIKTKTVSRAPLYDDPIISPREIFEIPAGTQITFLAYENFSGNWAFIETTYSGKPIRGFINKSHIRVK